MTAAAAAKALGDLHKSKQWKKEEAFVDELLAGDPQHAASVLSLVLKDRTIKTRTHIIARIEREKLLRATGILVELMQKPDEDEGIRSWCVTALSALKESPWARFHLQRVLVVEHDNQNHVRLSLAQLGQPYLQYYVSGLSDTDRARRIHAIQMLGVLKESRSVPALLRRLDSREPWESGFAGDSITQITGIPSVVITQTTKKPDGGVTTRGKRRPLEEFKQDCEAWLARNQQEVSRPIEESLERWISTPEKPLYTQVSDVLFKGMSGRQVESLLGKRRIIETGPVWNLPEDPKGNTLTLFMGDTGLSDWKVHNKTINQELKATGDSVP